MAVKSFNRTVEQINPLLDKLDALPLYPMNYKGELVDVSALPSEPTEGDAYLVTFAEGTTDQINKLYYRKANTWEVIATLSYTKTEIDEKFEAVPKLYAIDSDSSDTATLSLSSIENGLYQVLVSSVVSSTDYGVSMYLVQKTSHDIELFTAVNEVENAKISSISVANSEITITFDATGAHKVRFIGG